MPKVSYERECPYIYDTEGRRFPGFRQVEVWHAATPALRIAIDAYVDSGAERSLFDGTLATAMGIDLLGGRELSYASVLGTSIVANLHLVRLAHPDFGEMDLEVGFSTTDDHRNILGRDFFEFARIGFEERRQTVLISRL